MAGPALPAGPSSLAVRAVSGLVSGPLPEGRCRSGPATSWPQPASVPSVVSSAQNWAHRAENYSVGADRALSVRIIAPRHGPGDSLPSSGARIPFSIGVWNADPLDQREKFRHKSENFGALMRSRQKRWKNAVWRYGRICNVRDNVAVPRWPGHPGPAPPPGWRRKNTPGMVRSGRPQRA